MKESKWRDQDRSDKNERIKMKGSGKKWQKGSNQIEGIKKEGRKIKESKRRDKNEGIKIKGSRTKG